jgi:Mce-associated membrane protein
VSTPQPPRRRRIAGESKPEAPAAPPEPPQKSSSRKKSARKGAAPVIPPHRLAPARAKAEPAPDVEPEAEAVPQTEAPDTETAEAPAARTSPVARPRKKPRKVKEVVEADGPTVAARSDDSAGRRLSPAVYGISLIAAGAVVFGLFFGLKGWNDWNDSHNIVEGHDKAAATAASAAETIFSYRYDKLDDHLDDAKATMTPSFAKKFETISPALNDLAPQRKIQVKASTRDAAAIDCGTKCDAKRAEVLVFIDQARLADGSTQPTVFANRITLSMVKSNGHWLVNNIKAL